MNPPLSRGCAASRVKTARGAFARFPLEPGESIRASRFKRLSKRFTGRDGQRRANSHPLSLLRELLAAFPHAGRTLARKCVLNYAPLAGKSYELPQLPCSQLRGTRLVPGGARSEVDTSGKRPDEASGGVEGGRSMAQGPSDVPGDGTRPVLDTTSKRLVKRDADPALEIILG